MKYTTASQGGAIAASYPVITAVMARIFLKEKINLEITVQSDHGTSSISGLHLDTPVEVVRYILIRDEK